MPQYSVRKATRTTSGVVVCGWVVQRVATGDKTFAASILYDTEAAAKVEAERLEKLDRDTHSRPEPLG
jgi:hypothetical protein